MDFAFYRNFITVAETGNLSAAAKRLGIVQPALSAQMKAIERNYGVQLFKMQRGKRHIELTEAGETFLQQARQLCNTEDDISLRMQAFGRRAAGTLRFSVSHVRTDYFLLSYLIPFAKENPGISYQFHDATVEQQAALILPLPMRRCLQRIILLLSRCSGRIFMLSIMPDLRFRGQIKVCFRRRI